MATIVPAGGALRGNCSGWKSGIKVLHVRETITV